MAKAGKVHHWKHGWIPLDATALAERTKTQKSDPLDDAVKSYKAKKLKDAEARFGKDTPLYRAYARQVNGDSRPARLQAAGIEFRDEVDGVTFDTFEPSKDGLLDLPAAQLRPRRFTPKQKTMIASAINELSAAFPGAHKPRIVGYDDQDNFGVTGWDGMSIHLSTRLFDAGTRREMRDNMGSNGAIAVPYSRNEPQFVRAVVAHEFGHALQMQNYHAKTTAMTKAAERETAEQVARRGGRNPMERWEFDHLPHGTREQTVYGTANQFEWFAEAFADGYLHGDQASESGKWAVNMLHNVYGG